MEPIVNGLKTEYGDVVFFEAIDANSERGKAAMSAYGVRGHPSYVMLEKDGAPSWQFTGQIDEESLRSQLMLLRP